MNRPLTVLLLSFTGLITLAACGDSHHERRGHRASSGHDNHYKPGDGGIDLHDDEVVIRAGGTTEDAFVAPDGSLSLGRTPVEISPEGRSALKAYNGAAITIKEHGVALGVAGAKFGWKTASEVIGGLFDGTADEAGERAEEGAEQLVEKAFELCSRLDDMYKSQEAAAAAIPEFKPYAVIAQHQVKDCLDERSDGHHHRKSRHHTDDPNDHVEPDSNSGHDDAGDRQTDKTGLRSHRPRFSSPRAPVV